MEVIPRRTAGEHLARRNSRFIIDMRLCMRRLAHYMSVEIEQRFSWQRMMTRTREMDEVLKKLFMEGIETPDGGRIRWQRISFNLARSSRCGCNSLE